MLEPTWEILKKLPASAWLGPGGHGPLGSEPLLKDPFSRTDFQMHKLFNKIKSAFLFPLCMEAMFARW